MWYFTWILGLGLAATVGILNAMWFELKRYRHREPAQPGKVLDPSDG